LTIPWFLPFVKGWRYHVPELQRQLLSGIPVSFSGNFTVLNGQFPGYFVSAAVGTTDPNFITRASADGLTVIEVTVGDLRDARVYRNQMGEPNILSYGAYIRDFPLPVYALSLNGDGLPFYQSIKIEIIPRNQPAFITGFAANIIEIYDVNLFKESVKEFFESITPSTVPPVVPTPPRFVANEVVSTKLPVKVT
jgi:hypothetical protein